MVCRAANTSSPTAKLAIKVGGDVSKRSAVDDGSKRPPLWSEHHHCGGGRFAKWAYRINDNGIIFFASFARVIFGNYY